MSYNRRELLAIALGTACSTNFFEAAAAQTRRVRIALHEFVKDQARLENLRRGIFEMKRRKPSDPLSWFYQAAIHGVTDQLICAAGQTDPQVFAVDKAKYWNQCPHYGQNSANFLPWHRAYTLHFEDILRYHIGDVDFALPYWDSSDRAYRAFPREFGIEHLDGNRDNNYILNINPLYHSDRDFFLCGYEHPFTDKLPLTELSDRAVDDSVALASPVFFGADERSGIGGAVVDDRPDTRGLLEQSPHDQIHRAVGGIVVGTDGAGNTTTSIGAMALPPTAGFDPIFPFHHANMDRLWAKWSCMPGKSWGALPEDAWFEAAPWYFFNIDGTEISKPRKAYFDHRALGIAFADEDLSCKPLMLPIQIAAKQQQVEVHHTAQLDLSQNLSRHEELLIGTNGPTSIALFPPSLTGSDNFQTFRSSLSSSATKSVELILEDIDVSNVQTMGFDVYISQGVDTEILEHSSSQYLGAINLFVDQLSHRQSIQQQFPISNALQGLSGDALDRLRLVFVPYELTTKPTVAGLPLALPLPSMRIGSITIKLTD